MAKQPRLDLITSGDELLLGIRLNSHVAMIGREIGKHGLALRRNLTCRDSKEGIQDAFRCSVANGAEIILITGGLGPTRDDNTREAIAEALGLELILDEAIREHIREWLGRRGVAMTDDHLRQCYVPTGATVLPNPMGTAPGLFLRDGERQIFLLPGPTAELEPMIRDQVIPKLCSTGICNYDVSYVQLRTCGTGESLVQAAIAPVLDANPGIDAAFCHSRGIVDVRLSAIDEALSFRDVWAVADECRKALGEDFFC